MALVVIYVYNFKVLPLEESPMPTEHLQDLLAFLQMGLALFVLTAVMTTLLRLPGRLQRAGSLLDHQNIADLDPVLPVDQDSASIFCPC